MLAVLNIQNNKTMDKKLVEKIQDNFIGSNYQGSEATKEELEELTGMPFRVLSVANVSDNADDDDPENTYILYDSFQSETIVVHICYGDEDYEINYVDVAEPAL